MDKKFILFTCDKRDIKQYIPVEDIKLITFSHDIMEEKKHYQCCIKVDIPPYERTFYVKNTAFVTALTLNKQLLSILVEMKEE